MNTKENPGDHALVHPFYYRGELIGYIALHRIHPGIPAFGATRLAVYDSQRAALDDALRLSRLMSHKAALANLHYGGAKAAVRVTPEILANTSARRALLGAYCDDVNALRGRFITGADMGVTPDDVNHMRAHSPFIVGVSNDPVRTTAIGIIAAMEAALDATVGNAGLARKRIAIQGVGKIGAALLEELDKEGAECVIADIDPGRIRTLVSRFPRALIMSPGEIHKADADIFAPCATGGTLNEESANEIRARIIAGGANNQLSRPEVTHILAKRGIMYVPDYVANAGGLISVVKEYESKSDAAALFVHIRKIRNTVADLIVDAKQNGGTLADSADRIAAERIAALGNTKK